MNQRRHQLDTLLRLRQAERDQRRAAWDSVRREELAVVAEQTQVATTLTATQVSARRSATFQEPDLRQLCEQQRYGQALREQLADLGRRQELLREQLDELHRALLTAERNVRILEKLREKRGVQARAACGKSETGQLRELTLQKVGVAPTGDFSDK